MKLGISVKTRERIEMKLDEYKRLRDAGFTSFWSGDHMVSSPARYSGTFGDPLMGLACIAATVGPDVTVGTTVLVGPLYGVAPLNRSLATLASYCDHPIQLGLGVGWNKDDYFACGVDFTQRGKILDQLIRDLRWMWADPATRPEPDGVSAQAQLIIDLDSAVPVIKPQILTGGGREDKQGELSPTVARRIAFSDGFIINPNEAPQDFEEDLAKIAALGGNVRGPEQCVSMALIHLAPENLNSEDAKAVQRKAFLTQMFGTERSTDQHVDMAALLGTREEIMEQLQQRAEWGIEQIVCVSIPRNDPEQLRRLAQMAAELKLSRTPRGTPN